MAFMRLENVLPTLLLCAVITTRLKPTSSQRTTTFAFTSSHINVLKNETVEFICEQNANFPFKITYKGNIVIVENRHIKEEFLDIFDFQMLNSNTGKLTLKHATEEYTGTYKCGEGVNEKYAAIDDVYTLIGSKPICKSSIEIEPYIFEDQIELIEMNCTSEDGIPRVNMSNHIIQGNKTTDVTSISTKTTSSHPHPSKTLSFSPNLISSFNNSVFVCNVSQQLPAPYYQNYQGSCSFGPILLLHLFSVAVTPSEIICSKVKNQILKCNSNVSEVNLTWTKIPTHWKFDIKGSGASIELTVSDTGSDVCPVKIQCVGNYRNRNINSTIHIRSTNNTGTDVPYGDTNNTSKMDNNEINDPGRVKTVALVITAISLCLIFVLIVIVVLYFRLNVSFCNRNPDLAKQNSSTNNANDRNTTITDDVVSSMGSYAGNSALDVPAMIDNTIYEAYTEKDCQNQTLSETERLEKEQEIEMVENEIYESNSFSGYG